MNTIGENISVLRKRRNMTQEALANLVGVSAQSVSKWENNTNMPDISLLPLLADIFRCSIDNLFGRDGGTGGTKPERVLDNCCETVMEQIASCGLGAENDGGCLGDGFKDKMAEYKKDLRDDPSLRSAVVYPHGMVYYRDELGALLLKRPKAGWHSLLEKEGPERVFRLLADRDFRIALAEICNEKISTFTLSFLCGRCGIQDQASLEQKVKESHIFREKTVDVDGREITVYEVAGMSSRLALLFAVLLCAAEYSDYRDVYELFYTKDILSA